jgi:tetratricopeptide (TPR) repeat protein
MLIIPGEYEQAQKLAEDVLALYRALGAPRFIGEALARLGWTRFVAQGDQTRAITQVEQGLALSREMGHRVSTGQTLFYLGVMRAHQGKLAEARTLLEESLDSGTGQLKPCDRFQRQTELARLLVQQGELTQAQALYQEHQAFLSTSGYKYLVANYLEGIAALEVALGGLEGAARLWGAAEALREALGAPMFPVDQAEYTPIIAAARTALGEAAFAAAWAEGRHLTPEAALASMD